MKLVLTHKPRQEHVFLEDLKPNDIIGFEAGGQKGFVQQIGLNSGNYYLPARNSLTNGNNFSNGWSNYSYPWSQVIKWLQDDKVEMNIFVFNDTKELFKWLAAD